MELIGRTAAHGSITVRIPSVYGIRANQRVYSIIADSLPFRSTLANMKTKSIPLVQSFYDAMSVVLFKLADW
jgi:hypothetical protein